MSIPQATRSEARQLEALERTLSNPSEDPIKLSYRVIEIITQDFAEEIGRGGFGVVYLGFLPGGKIAVKKLSNSKDLDDKLFTREINCLMRVKHKNIVRFLGYCVDTQGEMIKSNGKFVLADVRQRILCFEYVPNGNLYDYLKEEPSRDEWHKRYQIIRGICQGLNYLHEELINHLDLKPENVMLDAQMKSKITDFGLSRCFDEGQSRVFTQNIYGTPGYVAPEAIDSGEISYKSDIFSLGIIIIKLLAGRNKYDLENWQNLLDVDGPEAKICIEIAQTCLHTDQHKRPTIGEIIHELNELQTMIRSTTHDETPLKHQENGMANLSDDVKELTIEVSTGVLSSHDMDGVESMEIDESNIRLSDLQKLKSLRSLYFKSCNNTIFEELGDTVVLHSVQNLHIENLAISGELFSKVLRCFPALSQLTIKKCENLELLPVEDGGLLDLKMLQSFIGFNCAKLFSRWVIGEEGGRAHAIKPFPNSLRELYIFFDPSMQSMGLLSNLTSLTSLHLIFCERLTMDGFNPLITVNLKKLYIYATSSEQEYISIADGLLSEIARSGLMHAGSFQLEEFEVDSISAVLTAPVCSHLAATLHILKFSFDQQVTAFTKQQEQALQLLTSLQHLGFCDCKNLQSLPGLRGLSSLKTIAIYMCKKILSLPPKEGLPTSLEKLEVWFCGPEVTKQAEKLKGADPWFSVEGLA